jgi:hypothetical protein
MSSHRDNRLLARGAMEVAELVRELALELALGLEELEMELA